MSVRRTRGVGFVRERGENGRQLVVKVDGKQYVRAVHTETLKEARKLLPGFYVEAQSGALDKVKAARAKANDAPTFTEAVAEFLDREMGSRPETDATRQAYASALKRAGRTLGDRNVSDIDRHAIRDCLLDVNRESALNTTKLVHCALGLVFRNLADREVIAASPVQTLKALKLGSPGKEALRREALSGGQIAALLKASVTDPDVRLWIEAMAATGMRPGEALALTWSAIDPARRTISVLHSVKESGIKGQGRLGTTKNKATREVPLGPALASALERAYLERESTYRQFNMTVETDDCVFAADLIDARKVPKSMGSMSARFNRVRDAARLKKVTPHWLRHSALTAAIAGNASTPGISMADAAALAGHSNASMIARVYGHAIRENVTRGVALADALIGTQPTPHNVTLLPARK